MGLMRSRAGLALLGAALMLALGGAVRAQGSEQPSCGLDCAVVYSASNLRDCLVNNIGKKKLVFPGMKAYREACKVANARFFPKIAAMVYARNTADVAKAVSCGTSFGVRVSAVGGRHAYQGLTMVDGYLAVDLSNMTKLELVNGTGGELTALAGPGLTNTLVATGLRAAGPKDTFIVQGQCPSVGIGGYLLGGGLSLTSRTKGMACDSLVSLEMVLFNGTVIRANRTHHTDLMWASCGGTGGLGIVTEFEVKVHRLPSKTFTRFIIAAVPGKEIEFEMKISDWVMKINDPKLAGGGSPFGASFGLYWGSANETKAALAKAGLQDPSIVDFTTVGEFERYSDYFLLESCELWIGDKIGTIFPGKNITDCRDPAFLLGPFLEMASTPGSPISSGIHPIWHGFGYMTCRLLDPPTREVWQALTGTPNPECAALKNDTERMAREYAEGTPLSSRCYAARLLEPGVYHWLAGQVAKVEPNATAFWYRKKYSPICYDVTLPDSFKGEEGTLLDVAADPKHNLTVVRPRRIFEGLIAEVQDRLSAVHDIIGHEEASIVYTNYQQPPQPNWQRSNWGGNVERLAAVKARYDPLSIFSKPLIVDGVQPDVGAAAQ